MPYLDNHNSRKVVRTIRQASNSSQIPDTPQAPAYTTFAIAPQPGPGIIQTYGVPVSTLTGIDGQDIMAQNVAAAMGQAWTEWPTATAWILLASTSPAISMSPPLIGLTEPAVLTAFPSNP